MYESNAVDSPQDGPHERLEEFVQKHIDTKFRKPYQAHNVEAFNLIIDALEDCQYPSTILDSCCGTGLSTRTLAKQNTNALVIGIDQSAHRLGKSDNDQLPENCLLIRANCEDIWRLCAENNVRFDEHYILYPNPYPKSVQFKRRWHAHPTFPYLKNLAGKVILRSNWSTYLEEFSIAWKLLTGIKSEVKTLSVDTPLTLFEQKYVGSGQEVFELVIEND